MLSGPLALRKYDSDGVAEPFLWRLWDRWLDAAGFCLEFGYGYPCGFGQLCFFHVAFKVTLEVTFTACLIATSITPKLFEASMYGGTSKGERFVAAVAMEAFPVVQLYVA